MPHHRLIDSPMMRLAQPTDTSAICAMPSSGRWRHVTEAATALRGAALSLGGESAIGRDLKMLLFEVGEEIVAVSALRRATDPEIAQLITVVIHQGLRGSCLRRPPRSPLCVVVLDATMKLATGAGYKRIAAHIADADEKGRRLADGFGFSRVGTVDEDHGIYAARL